MNIERPIIERLYAMRMGWAWSQPHLCYIRASLDEANKTLKVELATPGHVPKTVAPYLLRWQDDPAVLDDIDVLLLIKNGHRTIEGYEKLVVTTDGQEVKEDKK